MTEQTQEGLLETEVRNTLTPGKIIKIWSPRFSVPKCLPCEYRGTQSQEVDALFTEDYYIGNKKFYHFLFESVCKRKFPATYLSLNRFRINTGVLIFKEGFYEGWIGYSHRDDDIFALRRAGLLRRDSAK